MKQYNYDYHQGIKIKSPHLLRIRNVNGDNNQQQQRMIQLYKPPKLMSSNGQTTFSFKQQNNSSKNERVKLFNPIQQQQMVSYYNTLMKENSVISNNNSTMNHNDKSIVSKTNETMTGNKPPIAIMNTCGNKQGNKIDFAQIKELSTLESGENHKKYRKIKPDKLKELKAYRNSNMNTITSQANNNNNNNDTNSCYSNSNNPHKNNHSNTLKTISQKNYIDASQTNKNTLTHNDFKMNKGETLHTEDIGLISNVDRKEKKKRKESLLNRSQSVYSKKSIYSSDRSYSDKKFKRSHSNKRDVLMIIDQTIQGLNKLRTIFNDDDDSNEDESVRNYNNDSFEKEINRLQRKQLQNGIQTMTEFIRKSFNKGSNINKNASPKKTRNEGNSYYHKRTITEVPNNIKKNKRFNESEKGNKERKGNSSFYDQTKKKKNLYLVGINRNLTPIVAKKNIITNFDQEFPMTNNVFTKGKIKDNDKANVKMYNRRSNTNPNMNVLNTTGTNSNSNKKKKKGSSAKGICRYESENDTLANFQFSDVDNN